MMSWSLRIFILSLLSLWTLGSLPAAEDVVDICECGALGDGTTLNTAAIQQAIDRCAARGGGTVRLPAGRWLTGTVYLSSNVTVELAEDCLLLGSTNRDDYAGPRPAFGPDRKQPGFRYAAILAGSDLENVTVRGPGTIDGQGRAFRDKSRLRPKNIYLQNCRKVTIEGVRLRDAGCWMQHYRQCEDLTIRDVDVFNHVAFNNDGLNVDSCRDVLIENCRVDSDDDGIVLKSLSLDPCRNVVIRNCTVSSHCNGIKMGTESGGGFRDIEVTGCNVHSPRKSKKIYGAQRGLAGIALEIVDGGTLEHITVTDVQIDGVSVPLFLRLGNRARRYVTSAPEPGVGTFRNVRIRDITASNTSQIGCSITGLPGHRIEDVVLENIQLGFDGGGERELAQRKIPERPDSYPESTMFGVLPAFGFYCRHAEGLVFRNVQLSTQRLDFRHAMVFDDVQQLTLDAIETDCAAGAAANLRLTDVDGAKIRQCRAPDGADPYLLLEGEATGGIVLEACDLDSAKRAVEFGPGASREVLSIVAPQEYDE